MAENTQQNTNTEISKEEAIKLMKELMGSEDKKEEGIDTASFLWGMAAGAAITGASIYVYNKFFNED